MADRRMTHLFREAADIARNVPAEFRQAAFNKAVEMLAQRDGIGQPGNGATGGRETRVSVTGIAASDALIDKSVEAVAYAANRLGVEAVSADQIASILNDRFGMPAPASLVATALTGAGAVVRTASKGGKTLYRLAGDSRARRQQGQPPRNQKKPTHKARALKQSDSPADIVTDLLALGFFATARTTADVLVYLEKQGLEFTSRQIAPALLSLMRAGMLDRDRGDGKNYSYHGR